MQSQTVEKTPAAPAAAQRDAKSGQAGPNTVQRAAQQNYLRSLRGPAEQQGAAPPGADAGAAAPPPGAMVPSEKPGFWARAGAAAKGAAHWAGDKAHQAKDATVQAAHWTADKAGKAWDKTKQVAGDVYDVAKNTSVGYADGKVSGKTNVAEVSDLMPKHYRDAMQFDKSAKNEVSLEYDTHTGTITAKAATLALSKMVMGPLTAGPTTLTDVVLTLNRDAKSAEAKGGAGKAGGKKLDNLHATIHVGGVVATQVAYLGPNGLLKATSVELSGLESAAFNPGGGLPMVDGTKDHLAGTFSLDKATLRGISGDAMAADEISTSKIAGRMDQDAGKSSADLGGAQVKNGRFGNRTVESASIGDAHVGLQGNRGALPLADQAQQPLKVDTHVGNAQLQGYKAPEGSAKSASINGLDSQYDMATHNGTASLASANLKGAKVGGTQVKDASLTGVHGARQDGKLSGGIDDAALAGFKSKAVNANAARVKGVSAEFDPTTGDAALGMKSLRAEGLKSGKNGASSVAVEGVSATRHGDNLSADVKSASIKGAHTANAGGDLSVAGLHGNASMAKSGPQAGTFDVSATSLDGKNLHGGGASAGSAHGDGVHASRDAHGTLAGGINGAQVKNVAVAGETIESASVTGVSASRTKGGALTAGVESAQATNVSGDKLKAKSLGVDGIAAHLDGKAGSVSVAGAHAQGLDASGVHADAADLTKISASTQDGQTGNVSVAGAHAAGIKAGTFKAQSADLKDVAASGGKNGYGTARLGEAKVKGIDAGDAFKAGDASTSGVKASRDAKGTAVHADVLGGSQVHAGNNDVGKLDAKGLDASFGGANGKTQVDAQSLAVQKARFGDVSMEAAHGNGIGTTIGKGGKVDAHADALHADKLSTPGFSAGTADAHKFATQIAPEKSDFSAGDLAVQNAAFNGGGVKGTAAQASLKNGHASVAKGGETSAEVGKFAAKGVAVESVPQSASSSAKTTAPTHAGPSNTVAGKTQTTSPAVQNNTPSATTEPGLSKGALVRGLSQRVDQVDAKFSAPMRETHEGMVTVDPGTQLNAEVHARNNQLVPGQTGVNFSKELDGPAWIGVKGATLEADKKSAHGGKPTQGKIDANLSGFWDQDVTGKANEAMGQKGKTIPLSISELGDMAGKKLDADAHTAPAAPTKSAKPAGGSTHAAPANKTPAAKTPAKDQGPLDMEHANVDARVALSAGRVPLGGKQHIDLAQAKKGGNEINVRSRGGEGMVVDMVQVVLGSMNVQVGKKKVEADGAEMNDAQIKMGDGKTAGQFKGTIGSFETENIGVK